MQTGSPANSRGSAQTTCAGCLHFTPDPINKDAGMGHCAKDHGYWHPSAPHLCKQHEGKPDATHNP